MTISTSRLLQSGWNPSTRSTRVSMFAKGSQLGGLKPTYPHDRFAITQHTGSDLQTAVAADVSLGKSVEPCEVSRTYPRDVFPEPGGPHTSVTCPLWRPPWAVPPVRSPLPKAS